VIPALRCRSSGLAKTTSATIFTAQPLANALQAGLNAQGQLLSWRHRGSSPSIETFYNGTGISPQASAQVDSLDFPALFIPNFRLEFTVADSACLSLLALRGTYRNRLAQTMRSMRSRPAQVTGWHSRPARFLHARRCA